MGRKKKTQVFVLKPWCWYCEREFEDEKVLLQHQKSKHFKCQLCPRKLHTAGGLMVHSQQVHKCDPEPLTNTLPGRDGYDIEIFGMEGVPTNALAEWKARKEGEAGTAALAAAAAAKRPRHSYTVIPEADLAATLAQHKMLMASRTNVSMPRFENPAAFNYGGAPPPFSNPPFSNFPPGFPMPPPTFAPGAPPPTMPPQFRPPFPPAGMPHFAGSSPLPPGVTPPLPGAASPLPPFRPPTFVPQQPQVALVEVQPPKDGVIWPDTTASPAEKRAQQPRYRYVSPTPGEAAPDAALGAIGSEAELTRKRKAAADFL